MWDGSRRKRKPGYKQGRGWKQYYSLPCERLTHWKWLVSSPSALPALWSSVGSNMASRRTGASHGLPLLRRLLQAQGVKASGTTQIIPREPCSCVGQVVEAISCLYTRTFRTCLLVETIFLSCCLQIHQLNRIIIFGNQNSFSPGFLGVSVFLNIWCSLFLCCPGTCSSQQKWVWAAMDVNVGAPRSSFWWPMAKKEKYFISTHQSDDYDDTRFLEGTLKEAK